MGCDPVFLAGQKGERMSTSASAASAGGGIQNLRAGIYERREFLFAIFYAVVLGVILFLFGWTAQPAKPLIPALAAAIPALVCYWNRTAGTALGAVGVVAQCLLAGNAALAWGFFFGGALAVGALVMWSGSAFALLLIAGAPFLTGLGAAPLVPVALGIRYGARNGTLATVPAFLLTLIAACYTGNQGLFIESRNALLNVAAGTTHTFLGTAFAAPDFSPLIDSVGATFAMNTQHLGLLFAAWVLAAALAGFLCSKRAHNADLATEFLRRVGDASAAEPGFLRSPMGAALIAGLAMALATTILPALLFPTIHAPVALIAVSVATVPVMLVILHFRYRGDRKRIVRTKEAAGTEGGQPAPSGLFKEDPRITAERQRRAAESQIASRATVSATVSAGSTAGGTARQSLSDLQRKSGILPEEKPRAREEKKETAPEPATAERRTEFKVQGKIDGQYTIDKLRSGGMGVVYIVTDDFSGKRYAVKSLKDEFLTEEDAIRRFEIEAKTWINLDQHANIVQAMLFRVIEGRPLLFLEYIDGTDLDKVMNMQRDFPLTQILDWALQVCRGMAYAHSKNVGADQVGLVHRDLKPANLMLTRNGVIKITDFGLAKVTTSVSSGLTRKDAGIGTPYYMPPEQIDDAKSVDKRADIYSFGAVLYELLTGNPPFRSESISGLYMQIASKDPDPPSRLNPDVPEALDRIVLRCLEKRRENRYSTFEEVEDELQAVAAAVPSGTTRADARPAAPPASSGAVSRRTPGRETSASGTSSGRVSSARVSGASQSGTAPGEILIEAVMFIDMAGSTDRGEIGDQLAYELKGDLDSYVRPQCERRNCTYLKGTGDGYMVAFENTPDAVNAARDIMRKVQVHNKKAAKVRRIDLRVGINYGEVRLMADGDRVGQTVNMAARVEGVKSKDFHQTRLGVTQADFAEVNRILLSERAYNEVKNLEGMTCRMIGYFDLKGFTGRHPIYEMEWE